MANVHDYLQWRGDLTFAERHFNDADNLILATLSYLDFTGIVPAEVAGGSIALGDACHKLIERPGGDIASSVRSLAKIDTRFVELLAVSKRFRDARLCAYVDETDEARALQFAAITIDLPDAGTYVSYRGTDSTLVGWREDFMLSFCVTEAQREAAGYLERALRQEDRQEVTIRVGGHSKGGNLAEYAAACCPDELRGRIARVYSNDGPGMAPEVMEVESRELLGDRFRHIVPTYSVIGMLFAREDEPRMIVKSSGVGIGQHDPTTWQLTRSGIDEAHELQGDCMVLNEAVARWAAGVPLDERERVVNEVFDALEVGGATRFDEIASSPEGLQQVLHALGSTDERTHDLVMALVEGTVSSSMAAARRSTKIVLDGWRRGARELADDAARRLQGPNADVRVPVQKLRPAARQRKNG